MNIALVGYTGSDFDVSILGDTYIESKRFISSWQSLRSHLEVFEMIYILCGDEGETVSCWSTREKADEENARRGNEHYIEEKEIDPEHTVIPEGYVKGLIYHVGINKINGEIVKDTVTSRSRDIVYRDPEYLRIFAHRGYIQVYSAKSMEHAKEVAIQERQKWIISRTEFEQVEDLKEININPSVKYLQIGDIYEYYDEEGFLDEDMQECHWRIITLVNKFDIHSAYNEVMKSPGKGTKRIRRGNRIILSN